MRGLRLVAIAALGLALGPGLLSARPSNKWRIECSEGAKSDGAIIFRFTPEGGASFEVIVDVKNHTGENAVARRIRDVFRAKLDKAAYSVEVDDGEDVLVKKRHGQPDFDLVLVTSTVKAVRINLDRE